MNQFLKNIIDLFLYFPPLKIPRNCLSSQKKFPPVMITKLKFGGNPPTWQLCTSRSERMLRNAARLTRTKASRNMRRRVISDDGAEAHEATVRRVRAPWCACTVYTPDPRPPLDPPHTQYLRLYTYV